MESLFRIITIPCSRPKSWQSCSDVHRVEDHVVAKSRRGLFRHTRYRHACRERAELQEQFDALERSKPRTPAKKGVKTRRLNKLARQIAAAKGRVTKARNALSNGGKRAATAAAAKEKPSAAARAGWATRRARRASVIVDDKEFMPMLTADAGIVWIRPVGDDRILLGGYWSAVGRFLDNKMTFELSLYDGLSVFDSDSGRHFPFVTDPNSILSYHDHYDFGPSFYKERGQVPRRDQ